MQFREVLFQIRIVWSSDVEIYTSQMLNVIFGAKMGGTYDPWHFVVELDGPDVIKMTMQCKEASPVLGPDVCISIS